MYGTTSPAAGQFLLFMVPVLWISKLRQLRLATKIVQYLVLPVIPSVEFLMPLLPAPMQVIAVEMARLNGVEAQPVVPKSKGMKGVKEGRGQGVEEMEEVEMEIDDDVFDAEGEREGEDEPESEPTEDQEEQDEHDELDEEVDADDDVEAEDDDEFDESDE